MGMEKRTHKHTCVFCGKECRVVDYINRCEETGYAGKHFECTECKKLSRRSIIVPLTKG